MPQQPFRAADAKPRGKPSNYPEPFASRMAGRLKRPLGDLFGLTNFGVNLTTLAPGAESALLHVHSRQDEFVYVVEGAVIRRSEGGETILSPGMCVGFAAGGEAHQLINHTDAPATVLKIGDRTAGDEVSYPEDDLQAVKTSEGWAFTHKDGAPY